MRDPERLLERGENALDVELLSAGREDLPPRGSLERTLARVGVAGAGLVIATVATSTAAGAAGTGASATAGAGVVAASGKAGLFSGMSLFGKIASAVVAVSTFTATSIVVVEDPVIAPAAHLAVDNGSALSHRNVQEAAARRAPDAPAATPAPEAQPAEAQPTEARPAEAQPAQAAVPDAPVAKVEATPRSAPPVAAAKPTAQPPTAQPTAAQPTAAQPTASDLTEELKLLDRARQALLADRPAECIATLNDYRTRFPKGHLRHEAGQLRVKALTANGDASQAEREAKKLDP